MMTNPPGMQAPDPLIGTTVAGRYRIEEKVGAGAMGAVYRAAQSGLGRAVALKVLKRDAAWGGDTVQRFRREAQAMSALHHPNTVRVFDFGATDDGLLFLAMELLIGEPVTDQLTQRGALGIHDAVVYTQQVLRSIGEAHAKGIVHRDLKPDNIFVAHVDGQPEPVVKVLDFGIAKAIEGDRKIDQFETLDGTVFGTPRYMSPEQAAGKPLDSRSDLYSVGILLYEFLTGQPPFVDADAVVVMAKHIREAPIAVRRSAPQRLIPGSLEEVVSKALQKDPNKRFQSADEFDRALQECLQDVVRFERLSVTGVHKTPIARLLFATPRTRRVAFATLATLVACGVLAIWLSAERPSAVVAAPRAGDEPVVVAAADGTREVTPADTLEKNSATAGAQAQPTIVKIDSQPSGAELSRDGTVLGTTPLDVVVPTGQIAAISLRKAGFVDHTLELHAGDRDRMIVLNALPKTAALDKAVPVVRDKAPATTSKAKTRHRKAASRSASRSSTDAAPAAPPKPASPYEKF